jgi:hypothetical protein
MIDLIWSIARHELRLTEDEFLLLSYRQFALLQKRFLTLRWQDQYQQGAIWAAIHNNGFREYKEPPKPDQLVFTIAPAKRSQDDGGIFGKFRRFAEKCQELSTSTSTSRRVKPTSPK